MEGVDYCADGEQPWLPPGFRFHPTDEELITYYLARKVEDGSFRDRTITDVVDLNRYEPWELPGKAQMGEKEWYFYSLKDQKYSSGMRTNRATEAGYWKATGKHKEIFMMNSPKQLVGLKKTLVFYKGRAPKGMRTNWVMHEYRMEGDGILKISRAALTRQNISKQWVVCRIFHKSVLRGKKMSLPELQHGGALHIIDCHSVSLPSITDFCTAAPTPATESHVYGRATELPLYLANPSVGATTDVLSNLGDAPNATLTALADYFSHPTTSSFDNNLPPSGTGGSLISATSSQYCNSTSGPAFLHNHGPPSLTQPSQAAQSDERVAQYRNFRLHDISAAASCCLSADCLSGSCATNAPSGLLLPTFT